MSCLFGVKTGVRCSLSDHRQAQALVHKELGLVGEQFHVYVSVMAEWQDHERELGLRAEWP